MTSGRKRFLR
ncbi:hypothetical protein N7535_005796 [Penicillium sp. DV-2018c]|nr:hypothetical protein N7461_009371 [Penicillium sp. DV-2018c]KAJ5572136.1 hypothetical protein N7535_005796 [Penicillium sp. DV-2018c]